MRLQRFCPCDNSRWGWLKQKFHAASADWICTIILCFINAIWFLPFMNDGIIMGDDIGVIAGKDLSLLGALTLGGAKYRPVYTVAYVLSAKLFGSNYQLYFLLNLAVNTAITIALYFLLNKVTNQHKLLSLIFSVIFLLSPFSYYNVLQLIGLMEALCLLQLVLIFCVTLAYWKGNKNLFYLDLFLCRYEGFLRE